MPTTMVVRFPWGRYHATPWGRHVNEGQVEIPPSPWRLLRALYAVWQTRVPDLDGSTVQALLGRLAEPPVYFVPPYSVSHTRHYYPDSKHRRGAPSTDRTLDAFAVLERGAELGIRWSVELAAEERKALERLAESLPYLGRADSLCEARVDDDWEPPVSHASSAPLDVGESIPSWVEAVTVLAPVLPLDLEALVARPVDVRTHKLLFPPHTKFVAYERPPERAASSPARRRAPTPVQAVRFTLITRALPSETDALALTDRLRGAAVRRLNEMRGDRPGPSLLVGRDVDQKRMEGHRHAHYLAVPDQRRRIAELAVWIPNGLGEEEMQALSRVTTLWAAEGMPGPPSTEIRMAAFGNTASVLDDLVGPASVWESLTPFVPPRHIKRDWASFVAREVRTELSHRQMPSPVDVAMMDGDWRAFMRYRPSKRFFNGFRPGTSPPAALVRVSFDSPVTGPMSLGHLSHFGLGLFRPTTGR